MALLLTSVFGVAGCGSDDDVQVESRAKNAVELNEEEDSLLKAAFPVRTIYMRLLHLMVLVKLNTTSSTASTSTKSVMLRRVVGLCRL